MFVPSQNYRRRDLHAQFGGQRQGGISTPANHPLILLFTGKGGEQHGYVDGWQPDGNYFYTGEGQTGDMRFVGGNRAVRDHAKHRKDLHLFEQTGKAFVRYLGEFECASSHLRSTTGSDGKTRSAIVFELTPVDHYGQEESSLVISETDRSERLKTLRKIALDDAVSSRNATERKVLYRKRSAAIRQYVLERANGSCEACASPAPFLTERNLPYLEPHHIHRLSDGGPDDPHFVIAVCPNCHRKAHFSKDSVGFNGQLLKIVGRVEAGR